MTPGRRTAASSLPTACPVCVPRERSEEAGAPQAGGLPQVGTQGAAHLPRGGADTLGSLHGSAQGLVQFLQVLQVQPDGGPVAPGLLG